MELDDDGLLVSDVGQWTLEKHERLRRYIDITRSVRRKFVGEGKAGATYIDLFSGPGRSRIRESGELVHGSPIVAVSTAMEGAAPFSDVFLGDVDPQVVAAASKRVEGFGVLPHLEVGPADTTVGQVVSALNPHGLHFAFLDPYNLGTLAFDVIAQLSRLRRIDMLVHVSVQDLKRNLRRFVEEHPASLDSFAPGWRDTVDLRQTDVAVRRAIFDHWLNLIRSLDMRPSEGIERVSGSRNQTLYWLVLIARHRLAGEFWEKIRDVSGQTRLL